MYNGNNDCWILVVRFLSWQDLDYHTPVKKSVTDWKFTLQCCFMPVNHVLLAFSLSCGNISNRPSSEKTLKPHLSFASVPTRILKMIDLCCLLTLCLAFHIFCFISLYVLNIYLPCLLEFSPLGSGHPTLSSV